MFPWAPFRFTKAAVKLHTLLDLRGSIPTFIDISDGKMHDVNVLDLLLIEAGAFYMIIKKKLRLNVSLHTLLQILSLTLFEKLPLKQAVAGVEPIETNPAFHMQLNLFEF